jgi:hypothetical protein
MIDEKFNQQFTQLSSCVCDSSVSSDVRDHLRAHTEGCDAGEMLFRELGLCDDISTSVSLMSALLQAKLIEPSLNSSPASVQIRLLGFSLGFVQAKSTQEFTDGMLPWDTSDD